MTINVNAETLSAVSIYHATGSVRFSLTGSLPIDVYKSTDYDNFVYVATLDKLTFEEFGLEGGTTYYYRFIDPTGYECDVRYTTPLLFYQILPLRTLEINDTSVHFQWSEFKGITELYLNGSLLESGLIGTEYTITDLEPDTTYQVYVKNDYGVLTNTVTFKTKNDLNNLEEMLKGLFISDMSLDSDSDGLPDKLEPINDKLNAIVGKLGGDTINETVTTIENLQDNFSTGVEELQNLPKVETEFMGLNITILDLDDSRFLEMMETIRNLTLALLVVSFVFLVISFFDVQFKV